MARVEDVHPPFPVPAVPDHRRRLPPRPAHPPERSDEPQGPPRSDGEEEQEQEVGGHIDERAQDQNHGYIAAPSVWSASIRYVKILAPVASGCVFVLLKSAAIRHIIT